MDAKPDPGTIKDLIADALDSELDVDERSLREWHRIGLLGSPERRSRASGSGTDRFVYSSEQRALFRVVARNKASGAKNADLAAVPIYAWMNFPEAWVSVDQARRAMDLVFIGAEKPTPPNKAKKRSPRRLSMRVCEIQATRLLKQFNVNGARVGRGDFKAEVSGQLYAGRVDEARIRAVVRTIFEPSGIAIVRGPLDAPMTVDSLTEYIVSTMNGLFTYPTLEDHDLKILRSRNLVLRPAYERIRPLWESEAAPDIASLFHDQSAEERVQDAPGSVLLMIGLGVHRRPLPAGF